MARLTTLAVLVTCAPITHAQRGGLVEDLFRNIVRSQLERGQLDPNARNPNVPLPRTSPDRQPIPPIGSVRPGSPGGVVPNERGIPGGGITAGGIAVPSPGGVFAGIDPAQASYQNTRSAWTTLQNELAGITQDLQQNASRNAPLRNLLPTAYELSQEAQQLDRYARSGLDSRLESGYRIFDRDYRQFSFDLRRQNGISADCRDAITRCDRVVNRLSRVYGIAPQWNRNRFAEIALTAETYLQTMLDDLEILSINATDRRRLSHDLRLLASRASQIRRRVDAMTYDEASAEFNRFTSEMTSLGGLIRQLNNPHMDRRLDRLRGLADDAYGLFWMPPPVTNDSVLASARRIEQSAERLRDRLDARVLSVLDRQTQHRVEDLARDTDRTAHALVDYVSRDPNGSRAADALREIDASANELIRLTRYLVGNHHQPLAVLRDEVERLSAALSVSHAPAVVDYATLLRIAAMLEGTSEALRDQVDREERYLQPSSYRSSLKSAARDFYRRSEEFHRNVADRRDVDDLRDRAEELVDPWQRLTRDVDAVSRQGLPVNRAAVMQHYRDAMIRPMADLAAMLNL